MHCQMVSKVLSNLTDPKNSHQSLWALIRNSVLYLKVMWILLSEYKQAGWGLLSSLQVVKTYSWLDHSKTCVLSICNEDRMNTSALVPNWKLSSCVCAIHDVCCLFMSKALSQHKGAGSQTSTELRTQSLTNFLASCYKSCTDTRALFREVGLTRYAPQMYACTLATCWTSCECFCVIIALTLNMANQ